MDFLTSAVNQTVEAVINPPVQGADLYKGVDPASLNVLEQWWLNWYIWFGNPVIATGVMSFLMHEIVYFGRGLPWIIIDRMPSMRKYKLQDEKVPTPEQHWACTKAVLKSHFAVEGPLIWLFHPICEYFGLMTHQVPFHPISKMAWQIAFFFVFEDSFHYWFHRALHTKYLYAKIHKIHHEHAAPFSLAAEYAHPLEVGILGLGTILPPFLLCYFTRDLHILTVYVWITLRLWQAIDAHSGYDFPFSMRNWMPIWAGAEHHDAHHQNFIGNYASSFTWNDYMFGTDKIYRKQRARKAEEKRLIAKGMDKAQARATAAKSVKAQ